MRDSIAEARCFVSTALGFEAETDAEIREVWSDLLDPSGRPHALPLPEGEWHKGGIEYAMAPFTAVQLNFFLKTAHRVLLRLARFKAKDFPKLHEKLRKTDLRPWIGSSPIRLEVSASKSRLGHEGRILETAAAAWGLPVRESGVRVFIRLHDDVCDVSLDSTGEHLHRRGYQTLRGEAPLRENIAAFCLRRLIGASMPGELANVVLADPLCGSGTFLSEAASLWRPHFERSFSFQGFGQLPKLFKQEKFSSNYRLSSPPTPFKKLFGADKEPKMVEISRKNLEGLLERFSPAERPSLHLEARDVLESSPARPRGPVWIITNPPYGERIPGPPLDQVLGGIVRSWGPERVGMLVPAAASSLLKSSSPMPLLEERPVLNGGIDCRFMVFGRS